MSKQDGTWLDLADKVEQLIAIGVSGQIKVFNVAALGNLASTRAKKECLARLSRAEPASRGVRISITDKEHRLVFISDHSQRERVRRGILAHHTRRNHKDSAASEFHLFCLAVFQDNQIKRFVQLKVRKLPMGTVRFQIIYLAENAT